MNKFLAMICIICFVMMAGLVSCIGVHIPDYWTLGKTVCCFIFVTYEILCLGGFIYFWLKRV